MYLLTVHYPRYREQMRRKKPPYMDFNYPLNAFPSNPLNEFPPKPNFSMEAKPAFQHSTPFQTQIPRAGKIILSF